MIADRLGELALVLMQGPILLLLGVVVLLMAAMATVGAVRRARFRRARRRVRIAVEDAAAEHVVVPEQRAGEP